MSRSRRRGGGRGRWLVVLAVVALLAGAVPAATYSTADAPRGSSVAVADDLDAVVGLDVAPNVTKGQVEPLVNVTNRFDAGVTVTVAIAPNSPSSGTLYYDTDGDGTLEEQGTAVSFGLAAGGLGEVYVDADNPNSELVFDTTVEEGGVSASLPGRSTTVESGGNGNGNGGNCNGNGPNCG